MTFARKRLGFYDKYYRLPDVFEWHVKNVNNRLPLLLDESGLVYAYVGPTKVRAEVQAR